MVAQIEQLPDLAGYLKLASAPEWLRVRLSPQAAPRPQSRAPLAPLALSSQAARVMPDGLEHERS
jgi:hypothetical protein